VCLRLGGDARGGRDEQQLLRRPWLFNCRNDPAQRAIWKAERRAIRFAQQNGVTVVAAEGNQSEDMSHPSQDKTSPDDTTPVTRDVTNACVVIPTELPA
jgi:lantibiotic leader peptide-processing serine protease